MGIVIPLLAIGGARGCRTRPGFAEIAPFEGLGRRTAANAPLDSLAGGALASRFHAWRGLSGRRYVCSVFPAQSHAPLGGLPEFDDAVALAVETDAWGQRRTIAVFELCWRDGRFCGDFACVSAALRAGVHEWHAHLLAEGREARRAAIDDLAFGLVNGAAQR